MTENEIMMKAEHYRGQIGKDICVDTELFHEMLDLINRKNAKIEKLNFENLQMVASIKGLRAEAIKEFAERVKEKQYLDGVYVVDVKDIDQIAKEMGVEL